MPKSKTSAIELNKLKEEIDADIAHIHGSREQDRIRDKKILAAAHDSQKPGKPKAAINKLISIWRISQARP